MSSFDYESNSDGDWDNSEDLAWNEFDWQQYLKKNEKEIAQFLTHFHRLKQKSDHLDEIARLMGWDQEDWGPLDSSEESFNVDPESIERRNEAQEDDSLDPYTVHKHPVYIVTHGLYQHLFRCLEQFTQQNSLHISPIMVGQISASLRAGEINALMAINALDMADFHLTICHLKNALNAINHTFSLLQSLEIANKRLLGLFQAEMRIALFDLREVWLRVMTDCREESRRKLDDSDDASN